MSSLVTLVPAYGRVYNNAEEVAKDWNDNKDFLEIRSRSYCNKEDALEHGLGEVELFYNHQNSVIVKVT